MSNIIELPTKKKLKQQKIKNIILRAIKNDKPSVLSELKLASTLSADKVEKRYYEVFEKVINNLDFDKEIDEDSIIEALLKD